MTDESQWPQTRSVYLGAWDADAGLARNRLIKAGFSISEPQSNAGSQGLGASGVEATVYLAGPVDEQRFVQAYTEMFGGPPWEPSPIEKIMGKWRRWRSKAAD